MKKSLTLIGIKVYSHIKVTDSFFFNKTDTEAKLQRNSDIELVITCIIRMRNSIVFRKRGAKSSIVFLQVCQKHKQLHWYFRLILNNGKLFFSGSM